MCVCVPVFTWLQMISEVIGTRFPLGSVSGVGNFLFYFLSMLCPKSLDGLALLRGTLYITSLWIAPQKQFRVSCWFIKYTFSECHQILPDVWNRTILSGCSCKKACIIFQSSSLSLQFILLDIGFLHRIFSHFVKHNDIRGSFPVKSHYCGFLDLETYSVNTAR